MQISVLTQGTVPERMQVLASCVALSQSTQNEVIVYWSTLDADFQDLFQTIKSFTLIENKKKTWLKKWFGSKAQHKAWNEINYDILLANSEIDQLHQMKSDFLKVVREFENIAVSTNQRFYGDTSYINHLVPSSRIQKTVNDALMLFNDKPFEGILIQEEGNENAILNSVNHYIQDQLSKKDTAQFLVVCPYNPKLEKELASSTGRVKYLSQTYHSEPERQLVQLLCLAQASDLAIDKDSGFVKSLTALNNASITFLKEV